MAFFEVTLNSEQFIDLKYNIMCQYPSQKKLNYIGEKWNQSHKWPPDERDQKSKKSKISKMTQEESSLLTH